MKKSLIACCCLLLVLITAPPIHATSPHQSATLSHWQAADAIYDQTLTAQAKLLAADRTTDPNTYDDAQTAISEAQALYEAHFAAEFAELAPQSDIAFQNAIAEAQAAITATDSLRLGAARGQLRTALLWGSYQATLASLKQGDIAAVQDWLRLREYRQATKVSIVENVSGRALTAYDAGEMTADALESEVLNDLNDAYFFRFRMALNETQTAAGKGLWSRAAEWAWAAEGYFVILRDDFTAKRGPDAVIQMETMLAALKESVSDQSISAESVSQVRAAIGDYLPVKFDAQQAAERGHLLVMFLDLVYIEYKDGVRAGKITTPIEYQEALTFSQQSQTSYDELRPIIAEYDPLAAERLTVLLPEIHAGLLAIAEPETIKTLTTEAAYLVESNLEMPSIGDDSQAAFAQLEEILDDLERAARQGRYADAERLRIQAYAVWDTGPELRLAAREPELMAKIEGLFWQGTSDQMGLAQGIARKAKYPEIAAARADLDSSLALAQVRLSRDTAPLAVIFNTAVIVFREGLEAVVILAALMASMASAKQKGYRKPVAWGAAGAFVATVLTFGVMGVLLGSLRQYGEKLEAIVSLIAIGVLLLITNWFFHKAYWTNWMARFHRAKSDAVKSDNTQTQFIGLLLIGFTSIYREGFETALFLQASVLDAGLWVVLQGVALGLIGVLAVGYVTFKLGTRLPYKGMLILTGAMIVGVLFTMVGHTIHIMQAVGWMPITPLNDLTMPYWMGLWLGMYPTLQTLGGQIITLVLVLGSYGGAELWRSRKRWQRRASQVQHHSAT